LAAGLVAVVTYLAYVGVVGSGLLVTHRGLAHDCRNPATLGWDYEAVNYDAEADEDLARLADPQACAQAAPPAGDELVTSDGIRIAAWYIPATGDIGPEGPTVVLAHGWGGSKAGMLGHAALLRDRYNVVAFDFRHHGQSSGELTTQGVHERRC
jgi:predicted alpha/beta-fold hydrolase